MASAFLHALRARWAGLRASGPDRGDGEADPAPRETPILLPDAACYVVDGTRLAVSYTHLTLPTILLV